MDKYKIIQFVFPSFRRIRIQHQRFKTPILGVERIRSKQELYVIYPLIILFRISIVLMAGTVMLIVFGASRQYNSKSYRNSRNYKKVIKEGVLFDTIEYHEI